MSERKPYRSPKPRQGALQMRDIARLAGVSAQTVSRYFRNPEQIRPHNRERIAKVVADTGYFPNPAASSLSANRTTLVAVIVPTIAHSIFSEMVAGLSDTLERQNYGLLIATNAYSLGTEEKLVERFLAHKVAGIALIGQQHSERTVRLLRDSSTPTVELLEIDAPPIDMAIGLSNFDAARELTARMIAFGCRKIGFISAPPKGNDRVQRRMQGYIAALEAAGRRFDETLAASADFSIENGAQVFADMLQCHPDLDGIISNDIHGLGVQLHCNRIGMSVPDQMAITGFDNLEVSSILDKRLTTVKIGGYRMGALAGEKILQCQSCQPLDPKIVDLGYEILWRGTTPL